MILTRMETCIHRQLPLTQEALSQILSVRRTTVMLLMRNLRAERSDPSDVAIDRSRLTAAACECHGTNRLEVEGIFSMNTAPISLSGCSG